MYEFHFDNAANAGPGSELYLNFLSLQNHILIRRCIFSNNCELHSKSLCVYVCVCPECYIMFTFIFAIWHLDIHLHFIHYV